MKHLFRLLTLLIFQGFFSTIALSSENQAEKYFDKIVEHPQKLAQFLYEMPKGGELHSHLGGASFPENLIRYAKQDNFCIDPHSFTAYADTTCHPNYRLNHWVQNEANYYSLIKAWSMKDFERGQESGHDHFFSAFSKFGAIADVHTGDILSEILERAARQNEIYAELMITPDENEASNLGLQFEETQDFEWLRTQLLANGLNNIVANISQKTTDDALIAQRLLSCGTPFEKAGCQVKVRYLYQVYRENSPNEVFAQLLAGFEVANTDSRFVGINLVQPEDGPISMRDYSLHMQMIAFLHRYYPHVKISLHAGELVPDLVPPEGLRFHIAEAIQVAHASRIGHGVDIAYEDNYEDLLKLMSQKGILVEINLHSNEAILNVSGEKHPLPLYLNANVPVNLNTDDEGILRKNLTQQYQKAVLEHHLSYKTIKNLARNTIAYSFLPGKPLWDDGDYIRSAASCKNDTLGTSSPSMQCQQFLNRNEKAQLQWQLEKQFLAFENQFR